jgi:acetyl esterase/lipase
MNPREILTRPAPSPDHVISYGPGPEQVADLWLPAQPVGVAGAGAVIVLLHGGFWRAAFDRMHARPMAAALAAEGFTVCMPEYRRTGQEGGGWPGTFDDVALAVDVLPGLAALAGPAGADAVAGPPVLAGHSAGGHLALWAAARERLPAGSRWHSGAAVGGVVALAAVSDLTGCAEQDLGGGAAAALMGGGPGEWPDRYALADPMLLLPGAVLPGAVPVRLVHGEIDDIVPCGMSVAYAERVVAAGGDAGCEVLPGCGHFEVIDPLSGAWPQVMGAFRAVGG